MLLPRDGTRTTWSSPRVPRARTLWWIALAAGMAVVALALGLARLRERWARRGAEGGEPAIWPDRFMMGLLGESILSLDTKAGGFFGPYEASAP